MNPDLNQETIYDVTFVALVPTESSGQVAWEGSRNDVHFALENYLSSMYGPKKFKITKIDVAETIGDSPVIHIPASIIHSKEEH